MDQLLIIRLSALGDVLHTLPAVLELRAAFPGVEISWAVEPPYAELVSEVSGVDDVIPVAAKRWRRDPLGPETRNEVSSVRRALRAAASGDTAVDFQGLVKSATLGWLSGAKRRFGFDADSIRERAALLFINRPIEVGGRQHVIEINRALARGVVAEAGGRPTSPVEPDLSEWAAGGQSPRTAAAAAEPFVALLPGAGRPEKLWPVDRWGRLARLIAGEHQIRPLVVWGPGEKELADAIEAPGAAAVAPPTTLRELGFLLSRAKLVIGGDTGPLHLAAALGRPVIGLYGPTDPARNGPWNQQHRCVETWSDGRSMSGVTVEMVMRSVREAIT